MSRDKIVLIEWEDSCTTSGWRARDVAKNEATTTRCETVGFILKRNKTDVTVFQSKSYGSGQVTDMMSIPRKTIRKITELKG